MAGATLILNSGWVPIGTATAESAITDVYKGVAKVIENSSRVFRSPSTSIAVPSVMVIPGMKDIPKKRVCYSQANIIYRDNQTCQYCGSRQSFHELEVDHVVPRSRFDRISKQRGIKYLVSSWKNCVCACHDCNSSKKDKLPEECGMRLIKIPKEPTFRPHVVVSRAKAIARGWMDYVESFHGVTVLLLDDVAA